jgi:NADH-quinone oxidoreductase subunit E
VESNIKKQLDGILSQYDGGSGDLIPILQEAQERFGYLSGEVMAGIAKFLRLPESNVFGVATFYAQFKFAPIGKRIVKVCRGTACHVKGGERILESVQRELGIQPGQTTDDVESSLEVVACIGACALAPTIMIDNEVQRKMTPKKVAELFSNRRKGGENAR